MTSYIVRVDAENYDHTIGAIDPTDLSTVQALWSALPPDLRLALAKACPQIAHAWKDYDDEWIRWYLGGNDGARVVKSGDAYTFSLGADLVELGPYKTLASAQSACDDALRAQGYVLDGDTPMTDPKTRALELVDELEHEAMGSDSYDSGTAIALRLAIAQIPTTSWQKPDVAPTDTELRILVEGAFRFVMDGRHHADGRWLDLEGAEIPASLRIIAWHPADSTELPEDWGTK